jgi:hypothetical protein
MEKFSIKLLVASAVVGIGALGGCQLLVGLEDTNLTTETTDAQIVDAPIANDASDATTPPADAGPPGTPVGDHNQTCAYGGANTYMTVSCNPGQVITGVTTALYGLFGGSCDDGFADLDGGGACPPTDPVIDAGGGASHLTTLQAMDELCVGLQSCTFFPNRLTPVINDPCSGTQKQFAIQITCGTLEDAGVDAGDVTSGIALDLDAHDPVVALGANVTSWKNKVANETAVTAPGRQPPTMSQTTVTGGAPMVRFTPGQALALPATNLGDPYLRDFSAGISAFAVVTPRGNFQSAGEHVFDFASSGATQLFFGLGELQGLVYETRPVPGAAPVNAPGTWTYDYPQLFSTVTAALPAGIVPAGNGGGATWGKTVVYRGTTPVGVGFEPLPQVADRNNNFLGEPNGGAQDFIGDLGEIVIYDRALDPVEMGIKQNAMIAAWHLCDGANFMTDPANCGGCGNICIAGAACDHGACTGVDLNAWSDVNSSADDGGLLLGPADGDAGANPLSWAQARNTCLLEQSQLVTPATSDANAILSVAYQQLPTTKERAVGVIRENGTSAINASTRAAASYSSFAGGAPAWGCAEMKTDATWDAVGCNTSAPTSWACQSASVTLPTSCPVFADTPRNRSYAFCGGPFPNEIARRAACASLPHGTELAVKDFQEAANVAALGLGTPSSIDLTNVRKAPAWTLIDGTAAPFIGWDSSFNVNASIPPFVLGPACAVLNGDGTMTDESCFASNAVVCGLPDGTPTDPAPTVSGSIPGFIDFAVVQINDTTRAAPGSGSTAVTGVKPGDTLTGIIYFAEVGRAFTLKVGFYPSNATVCPDEVPNPTYPVVSFSFVAPPLQGYYPLEVYPDSDCGPGWDDHALHTPTIAGYIQVVSP